MSVDGNGRVHSPAGTRGGGQFATGTRAEAAVALDGPAPYDSTDALAERGVPAGLLHGVDTTGREQLLDEIENRGLDRPAARDLVTRYRQWWTSSDTGPLHLDRGFRLEKAAREQLRQALDARRKLTITEGAERIEEAEDDVMDSWRRWTLARDDLRALTGDLPDTSEAAVRIHDPEYRGQLMPYPPGEDGAPVPFRSSQIRAELDAAERPHD